ncbi:EamA family transporter [Snuella sedimenti]|uniref:EamA family transporter n=1 Tax=Snuella sedimenti TaxID=2798802 RepID=A0A8J7IQF8_9FLAO|nr:EamA family transporter [Snuella sedimenti]MBJ6369237.1 EamA family transporter [Snuella sedimenti]
MALSRKTILILLSFFAIYVIWGSTYLLNKIAVTEIAPLYLSGIRFIIAGSIIFIIAKFMKLSLAVSKNQLVNACIAGLLFLGIGNGLFVWALRYVDSGFAALEASTQPIMILVLMRLFDGKKIKTRSIIGVLFGILGIYLLVSQKGFTSNENSIIGICMIFVCIISWSSASIFVSKAALPKNFFINAGYQMITGGFILFIGSIAVGEPWLSPVAWSKPTLLSMVLLIIFGSIVAFTSFNYLLRNVSPEKVSTNAYVNPIIALLLGWYVLDEHISLQSIIAAVVLLMGVYFINSKRIVRPRISGR